MAQRKTSQPEILLESGTNELEIVGFCLGEEYYGINVTKVREIIRATIGIVPIPESHPSVAGVINLRGRLIPVINLDIHLKIKTDYDKMTSRIIVSEFNEMEVGFLVNSVTRIHRLSWSDVNTPSGLMQSKGGHAVGITSVEERILFLLDFEKISADINPDSGIPDVHQSPPVAPDIDMDRSTRKILIAEDSPFIRKTLVQHTEGAGYNVLAVSNGLEAWKILEGVVQLSNFKDIGEHYHLLITDIEMPQMDGLHLIKRIRMNPSLKKLPCIVFSSMITPELAKKCDTVGADGQIGKPEIDDLVILVDKKVIK